MNDNRPMNVIELLSGVVDEQKNEINVLTDKLKRYQKALKYSREELVLLHKKHEDNVIWTAIHKIDPALQRRNRMTEFGKGFILGTITGVSIVLLTLIAGHIIEFFNDG